MREPDEAGAGSAVPSSAGEATCMGAGAMGQLDEAADRESGAGSAVPSPAGEEPATGLWVDAVEAAPKAEPTGVKKPRKGAPTYDARERIHVPSGSGDLRLVPRTSRAWGVWLVPDGVNACAGAEREQQEESMRHKRASQRAERRGRRE